MEEQGITFAQLAAVTGLNRRTIHNIFSGVLASKRSRQAITNAIGVQLWNDVRVIAKPAAMTIRENTVFLQLSEREADALHKRFPDSTQKHKTSSCEPPWAIEFLRDTPVLIDNRNPAALPEPVPATTQT